MGERRVQRGSGRKEPAGVCCSTGNSVGLCKLNWLGERRVQRGAGRKEPAGVCCSTGKSVGLCKMQTFWRLRLSEDLLLAKTAPFMLTSLSSKSCFSCFAVRISSLSVNCCGAPFNCRQCSPFADRNCRTAVRNFTFPRLTLLCLIAPKCTS